MSTDKFFAGTRLRELRCNHGLTQKALAGSLGISLPYFNQMENNNRPLTDKVIQGLAQRFGVDFREESGDARHRLTDDLNRIFSDLSNPDMRLDPDALQHVVAKAPDFAQAFLDLHQKHQQVLTQRAAPDETPTTAELATIPHVLPPTVFHPFENYVDTVDRMAEQFAMREGGLRDMRLAALSALGNRGWRVAFADATAPCVFDANRQTFTLSRHLSRVEQRLHLLTLTARLCFQEHLQRAARTAGSAQDADPETALEPLVRYFAIAALLPYRVFLRSAFACRYDVDSLARQFDVDADHVALRCAMLNRLGAKGLPCSYRRVSTYGATQTHLHSNAALCAASERVAISRPAGRPPIAQASSHNQIVRADDGRIVLQQMRETQADPKNKAIVVLLSDISRTQRGIKDGGKDGGASGAEQGRAQPDSASGLTARVSC